MYTQVTLHKEKYMNLVINYTGADEALIKRKSSQQAINNQQT
jgi:hypothetical protein